MYLKQLVTLATFITATTCFSQEKTVTDVTNVTRLSILSPGIGYEMRIAKYQTLYIQGLLSLSGGIGYSGSRGFLSEFNLDPVISLEYRYYYNFKKREENGKRVDRNSLNYLSPFFRTSFPKTFVYSPNRIDAERKALHSAGATWGLQRNYRSRISLDINIGIGYHFKEPTYTDETGYLNTERDLFFFPGRLSIGLWLNKRT